MASVPMGQRNELRAGARLLDCVAEHGSGSHPYASSDELMRGPAATRNLADAIHFLCALHGRYPGVVELAATHCIEPGARAWLNEASDAFARERAHIARLAVAAGPVPATPGTGSEAVLAGQRNAITTLAQSERRGCALGAALAFAADWAVIRKILDTAAERFGASVPLSPVPAPEMIGDVADAVATSPSVSRAMLFGAEQVALQHRGLWDLLRARAEARAGS